MRIGISPGDFTCFGEARYSVLRESGFDCVDFSMVDTESDFYLLSDELLERAIAHERELASEAGVEISQVHGPWRWPAHDAAPEEREERLEKMIRSIRMTARLGCKYWVVHPIMPFGIEEQDSELAPQTRALNIEFMRKHIIINPSQIEEKTKEEAINSLMNEKINKVSEQIENENKVEDVPLVNEGAEKESIMLNLDDENKNVAVAPPIKEDLNKNVKDLKVRKWKCTKCNNTNNRDINASINIMWEGIKSYMGCRDNIEHQVN